MFSGLGTITPKLSAYIIENIIEFKVSRVWEPDSEACTISEPHRLDTVSQPESE